MKILNKIIDTLQNLFSRAKTLATEKPRQAVGAGIIILVALMVIGNLAGNNSKDDGVEVPLFKVEIAPLTINLTESGTLKNRNEVILKCEVAKPGAIAFVLDEGSIVKAGDLVIELDSDTLQDQLETSDINVKKSEAQLISAKEFLEITKNQAKADVAKAELDLKFAHLDMGRFLEGLHPQNLEQANADITIAEESLERAQEDLAWSTKLHTQGFITRTELKADELSEKQKQITLKLKKTDRELLTKYTHPQEVATVNANLEQAKLALDRATRKARAEVVMAEADLLAEQSEDSTIRQKNEKITEQIKLSKIIAPTNGMVVYGGGGGSRHRGNEKRISVGENVHYRQELVRLSGGGEMVAMLSIQEASRPKVKKGMPALITVDALPGREFTGELTEIGLLPDSSQSWLNPDLKVYKCEVELDGSNPNTRPEMRCQVEIQIEHYDTALFVPVQCVLQVDGNPTVFVKTWRGFEKRIVKAGLNNNIMMHILNGLEEGEEVMLAPPLDEGAKNGKSHHKKDPKPSQKPEGKKGNRNKK